MHIAFNGAEAEDHEISAYTGASSLEGVARAAVLAAHYAATGKVRFRAPYSTDIEFFFSAPEEGSLTFPLKVFTRAKGMIAAHKKQLAVGLLSLTLARATGQVHAEIYEIAGEKIDSGVVDALAEAATPGLTKAHTWIDSPDKKVSFSDENGEEVALDIRTKRYLEQELFGEENVQDVSVAALNGNSKIGRVYFHDLKRTVPFKIDKKAQPRTAANLSRFLTQYINKTGKVVSIRYIPVYTTDERLKRIYITDCVEAEDGL